MQDTRIDAPDTSRPRRETALITGASAGIGRELASVFASHGFDLVLVARRASELEQLAASLSRLHGIEASAVVLDLATASAPQTLFDAVRSRGVAVDVLVNNAGATAHGDFADISIDTHLALVQLNVAALTALTHLFVRPMVARRHGRILNLASVTAFQPVPTLAVYAASKAYVLSLGEALAVELAGTGVTVTTVCPGFTETTMMHTASVTTGRAASLPGMIVSDAAQVARDAYAACARGDALLVPGVINQLATLWMQHQPRWLGRHIGGWVRWWG